jgi:hypothetical protein
MIISGPRWPDYNPDPTYHQLNSASVTRKSQDRNTSRAATIPGYDRESRGIWNVHL